VHLSDHVRVPVDASLLRRALANLFDNELSHAEPGTTVTVELTAEGAVATLTIEDDGVVDGEPGRPHLRVQAAPRAQVPQRRPRHGRGREIQFRALQRRVGEAWQS